MHFGIVNTYDLGACTGPFKCENLEHYGPTVGCETWNPGTNNHWPHNEWHLGAPEVELTTWQVRPEQVSQLGGLESERSVDSRRCCVVQPSGGVLPREAWAPGAV